MLIIIVNNKFKPSGNFPMHIFSSVNFQNEQFSLCKFPKCKISEVKPSQIYIHFFEYIYNVNCILYSVWYCIFYNAYCIYCTMYIVSCTMYIYTLLVWVGVCIQINIKTAELIGPKFVVGPRVTPGRFMDNRIFKNFLLTKFYLWKWWKSTKFFV